jgi:trehalose synthase
VIVSADQTGEATASPGTVRYVQTIPIAPRDPARFGEVLGHRVWESLRAALRADVAELNGRTVWNVNTTATGGGVAEMLRSLAAYARGAGADVRWAVISPPPEVGGFFSLTKRIHNMLHGHPGDGEGIGPGAGDVYRAALEPNAFEMRGLVRPGDVVILHDPQTAGLAPAMRAAGVRVVWRCHVGADSPNGEAHEAWDFLRPFVEHADLYAFSRPEHVWERLDPNRTVIVPPTIDVFSAKNQDLSRCQVDAILRAAGAFAGPPTGAPTFIREDRSIGVVERPAQMLGSAVIDPSAPLVTQVSRWDTLKDPLGVIEGFVRHVLPAVPDAQLAMVGPETAAVADDPEGAHVLNACHQAWKAHPAPVRDRIAIVCLPMADREENAAIVNAIQRHAAVVVQKSLAEGFGLTVSEAMWKSRPVVAARVGGIADQIVDGDSGVLVQDPSNLAEFGRAVSGLLRRPAVARRIGRRARQRVTDHFLLPRSLIERPGVTATLGLEMPLRRAMEA